MNKVFVVRMTVDGRHDDMRVNAKIDHVIGPLAEATCISFASGLEWALNWLRSKGERVLSVQARLSLSGGVQEFWVITEPLVKEECQECKRRKPHGQGIFPPA